MTRARDFADVISGEHDLPAGALDNAAAFDSGTLMIFQQTNSPTGWTKQTTHNDKAFRCVSGSCSSGGSTAFSTAMATPSVSGTIGGAPAAGNLAVSVSGTVGSTTLSNNQIPSHSHNTSLYRVQTNTNPFNSLVGQGKNPAYGSFTSGSTGGGGSHNHNVSVSGNMTGSPGVGNLSLDSSTAAINVQYVDVIIAAKD